MSSIATLNDLKPHLSHATNQYVGSRMQSASHASALEAFFSEIGYLSFAQEPSNSEPIAIQARTSKGAI